jgi:hypothetical protein
LSSSSSSSSLVAIIIVVVACRAVARRAVAIVVLVVASRHRCRHRILSCRHPSRRRHRCHRPSRPHHHRLRINTVTPHFSLGIPISVWGSPNQNGDPQTKMGINTSPYQNGDPRIGLGIVQSLTRIGLGFVPIWDLRVSSPNWNGIQNGDPISERGSPYRNGESPNWFPNWGVPESVWGSFQFGDQHP